ncbi:MAG TPA: RNA-directed DNA polymerase, partial [Rhabdaerophilum sp.]|nr:RNA-directed DNA polymerase [Rhabdaerophilum sp.]
MAKRHDKLFARIASFGALVNAARRALRGKRRKPGAAAFMAGLERECLTLDRQLLDGSYRPGRCTAFEVKEPKSRIVSAAPFRDRVVHHALMAVVDPIFEAGFIDHSIANRKGKGTHRAIKAYEYYRNRHLHVLRCDIFRYFPAIDHEVLKVAYRRRISCDRTLALLDRIVDASNEQEPVELYFPGDDLFEPMQRRRGLPIGNLTSQFFANLYLDALDHFATAVLCAPYVRYVDDFALFHDDPAVLRHWQAEISRHLVARRLRLHPRKTFIQSTGLPATFLGFELFADGGRRLPDGNVQRFRGRLRRLCDRWRAGTIPRDEIAARVCAWIAHAEHARRAGRPWRRSSALAAGNDPSSRSAWSGNQRGG